MGAIANVTIFSCWIIFIIYWITSANQLKAVKERQPWGVSLVYKVPTIIGGILLGSQKLPETLSWLLTPNNDRTLAFGTVLCTGGLLVAIWARRTLAGNWSSNITLKKEHELIRTGPYRYARHPIYTGLLLMSFGTALAGGRLHCWLGFGLFFLGFWIKLKEEEKLMLRHFPDQYPAYQREVKAIVPFFL